MRVYFSIILVFIAIFVNAQSFDNIPKTSDVEVIEFLSGNDIPITNNNKLQLLKSGSEKFDDLFAHIRQAKHHIHLEYFNFRNDSIANMLFDLLAERVQHGVEVRAIFDAFGNWSNNQPLNKKHLEEIRGRGIEIVKFDPIRFPFFNHIFHRDHRKIVVIDGVTAYTGGINIADYYIEGLPDIGDWRDMHVRIEGDAVQYLQDIFIAIWNETTKQDIGGPMYYPLHEQIEGKSVAVVDRNPRTLPKKLRRTMAKSISSAQKKIQIVNPYFIPTRSIKKELENALSRGVTVEIMISAQSDIKFTPDGVFHVAHKLMKKGANVYVYNNGFHHSKIMSIDDLFCTVGSANFDSRSLRFDYEVNLFIFDKEITNEINSVFEKDKLNSTLLTPEVWKKRSGWRRFVGRCANALAPFL